MIEDIVKFKENGVIYYFSETTPTDIASESEGASCKKVDWRYFYLYR